MTTPLPPDPHADETAVRIHRWPKHTFWLRSLMALGLLVAFYLFALVMVVVLFGVSWAALQVFRTGGTINLWIVLMPPLIGIAVLLALLPRGAPAWYDPVPRLNLTKHRLLAEFLADVARQTGQRVPRNVYIVPGDYAGVLDPGPFVGRVMILGLSLFETLSVGELRAIVAHEFGHFYAGDLGALGVLLYQANTIILRTANAASNMPVIGVLFAVWAELILRVTLPISRQQELRADALSCRIAGVEATIGAFTKIIGQHELVDPVAGWDDPHSTHPTLRDRLALARSFPETSAPPRDERPATVLLERTDRT